MKDGNVVLLKKDKNGNDCHKYHNNDFEFMRYHSVTTVKGSVIEPFDNIAMAERCGNNPNHNLFGHSVSEITRMWEEKGESAARYGTQLHKIIEDFIDEDGWSWFGNTEMQKDVISSFVSIMDEYESEEYPFIYGSLVPEVVHHMPIRSEEKRNGKYITATIIDQMSDREVYERIINLKNVSMSALSSYDVRKPLVAKEILKRYLLTVGIAGSVDIKFYNKDKTKYKVLDIKTDEKITTQSYNGKKMLYPPCGLLQDCKLNHYGLQTYMYGVIGNNMKEETAVFDGAAILHWDRINKSFDYIELGDYYQFARLLIGKYFELI